MNDTSLVPRLRGHGLGMRLEWYMQIEIPCNLLVFVDSCKLITYKSSLNTISYSWILKRVPGGDCSPQLTSLCTYVDLQSQFKFDAESDVPLTAQEKKVAVVQFCFLICGTYGIWSVLYWELTDLGIPYSTALTAIDMEKHRSLC